MGFWGEGMGFLGSKGKFVGLVVGGSWAGWWCCCQGDLLTST